MNKETKEIIEIMIKDQKVRRSIARENHLLFFSAYFGHYIEYDFADFHREMFDLSADESVRTLVITAARGIGKSTILNMSLAIWSILGKSNKKFVVILSHTQAKARQHYTNLRKELEENKLLKSDLGPFKEDSGEWGSSLVLPYYDARITFASTEQSIRGMRHKQHRPDLIIADDLEDNDSVKTIDNRNKTYDWLVKDIIPAGEANTKLVVIGTLLHEDSVMVRLKKEILGGTRTGIYREYPLVNDNEVILWPSKYPDEIALEAERLRIGDEKSWYQEYLLRIISDADRVIHPEWIKYYSKMPEMTVENEYRGTYIGIDLAISEKERADYTAMVAAAVFGWGDDMKVYILPFPINERLDFPSALEKAKGMSSGLAYNGRKAKLYIEDNMYQRAFPQMMTKDGYPAMGVPSQGDKRTRLTVINPTVKAGRVFFPETGAEVLIQQLIGFGIERHDDLADAFAIVIDQIVKGNRGRPRLPFVGGSPRTGPLADLDRFKVTRKTRF
jgi:predicted phage terminase large subunit-like protein